MSSIMSIIFEEKGSQALLEVILQSLVKDAKVSASILVTSVLYAIKFLAWMICNPSLGGDLNSNTDLSV